MANQLDKLPVEVLVEVLSSLPKADLKQARLSCRRLRNAGDRWLFQRIYFAPREKTMDAFKHIAANPAFNRHVTEIIYDGRLFQQHFLEPEMYYKAYHVYVQLLGEEGERAVMADCERAEKEMKRDMKDIKRTGSAPSERERAALKALRERTYHGRVFKSMKQYVQFYIQQERIFDTGTDSDMLCAGLKQMPNIDRLSIFDRFAKADQTWGVEHSWYENESTKDFGCSLAPMRWCGDYRVLRHQHGAEIVSDEDMRRTNRPWDCRGVVNFLKAAATQNPKIESVGIGLKRSNAPVNILDVFSNDPTPIHNIARGLNYLALHLSRIWTGDDFNSYVTPKQYSCVKTLLKRSKDLFSLVVDIILTYDQWNDLFCGLYFPHLITLHLVHVACLKPSDLIGFLERHKASLRELLIRQSDMKAEEGTWKDVAQRLGQSLKLRYIGLVELEDIDDTTRFKYSHVGYFLMAMLFIPSFSPQTHLLLEGPNVIEVVQRQSDLDPPGVKVDRLA